MKLIRLTEDRYVLDAGKDIVPAQMDLIRGYWTEWWHVHLTEPSVFVIGGTEYPVEYEDRREPDVESRLRSLEMNVADHEQRIGLILEEHQRLYDFVGDVDPSIIDAWHFGENVRKQREAAGD